MKICQVCAKPFVYGKNNSCSVDCYLEMLQTKLDNCFRRDTSHATFLSGLE